MAKVIITSGLEERINKIFKKEAVEILSLLLTLEENPKKGKEVGVIGAVVIKEIKYKKFRFYFITDGFKVKYLSSEELKDLLIKFVRMSEKKDQHKAINEIKFVLRNLCNEGF
ncbi:hypothetical protein HY837_03675 [archaeon]|nr:hypothetical protein [archaeon]